MAQFNPSDENADKVIAYLEKADPAEQQRVLKLEQGGKKRSSVLEPYGYDPNARVDGAGRELYPWEMDPSDHVYQVEVDESPEQRKFREAQAEQDELVAAATATQPAATAAGVGAADAPVATGGAVGDAGL